jgi:hypothetical protein
MKAQAFFIDLTERPPRSFRVRLGGLVILAGAVLEKALRKLCDEHQPPIATVDGNGNPKTLNPLIDDLKKANVFNELKAKQLRAWADIRNKSAHGQFDQFKRTDVEQMIAGVRTFLADYLC